MRINVATYKHCLLLVLCWMCGCLTLGAYSFMERGIAYNASGTRAVVTSTTDLSRNYDGLRSASIPPTVLHDGITYQVTTISDRAFINCPTLRQIDILPGITRIGSQAFQGCTSLSDITLPAGIVEISGSTFAGCTSLTQATLPSTVAVIDENAFSGCTNLSSVNIPSGVSAIGERAFENCSSLAAVNLASRVSAIEAYTFAGCKSLTSITLSNNIEEVKEFAFLDCSGLRTLTIGDNVYNFTPKAFIGCTSLTTVSVNVANYNFNTSGGVLTDVNRNKLIYFPPGLTASNGIYDLNARIATIGEYAFAHNPFLKDINLSNVSTIEHNAFESCSSIEKITFPYSASTYGDEIMKNCTALREVVFSDNITRIGADIFTGCDKLAAIHIRETSPRHIVIDNNAFSAVKSQCTLYVPVGTKETYESIAAFNGFKAIVEEDFYVHGDVNGDGHANGNDITTLFNYILNIQGGEDDANNLKRYDVNGDGYVNATDITELYNILLLE